MQFAGIVVGYNMSCCVKTFSKSLEWMLGQLTLLHHLKTIMCHEDKKSTSNCLPPDRTCIFWEQYFESSIKVLSSTNPQKFGRDTLKAPCLRATVLRAALFHSKYIAIIIVNHLVLSVCKHMHINKIH